MMQTRDETLCEARVLMQFEFRGPTNFSFSRELDKLKLVGHPTASLPGGSLSLALLNTAPYDRFTMPQIKSPGTSQPAERVFLIDSMSHIFRAFYAPLANRAAPLMTSKGQVTQAVYIFTNMLRKLIQDEKPKYIAAVFESKEKTFRHEAFTDYKANRQQMPEDLASQLPYIKRLCEAYNIPMITVPGFEADDVIG